MVPERRDESAAEATGHVVDGERRDRQSLVERVAAGRPAVERGGEQNEQAAAVDRAGDAAERVRREVLVGVEDDERPGRSEERRGALRFDAVEAKALAGGDERHLVVGHVGPANRVEGGVDTGVSVAGEDEEASLVRRQRLLATGGGERLDVGVVAEFGHRGDTPARLFTSFGRARAPRSGRHSGGSGAASRSAESGLREQSTRKPGRCGRREIGRFAGRADASHGATILKALLWGPEQRMVTACPGLMNLLAVGKSLTGRDRPTGVIPARESSPRAGYR